MKTRLFYAYLALAAAGTLLPMSQFLPWALDHGLDAELFARELFSTRIGGFFGWDVFVSALVLVLFVLHEGRRLGMSRLWMPVAGVFCVGVSLGLPLFLAMRERHLAARATTVSMSATLNPPSAKKTERAQ